MVKKEIVIIGAGASGLMAAGRFRDRDIALVDANARVGEKIRISGGGKCNITNKYVGTQNYLGNAAFVKEILSSYDQKVLLEELRQKGLKPVLRKQNQYFCPKSATELLDILERDIHGVKRFMKHKVVSVQKERADFLIETEKGVLQAKKLVVASGGMSFPKLGASAIAFEIAKSFGHTVRTPKPALVGLTLQKEQFWMKELSGISLPVKIEVGAKKIAGDLLFAHKGISGPAVLNASLYWEKGEITLNFLPEFALDEKFWRSKKLLSTALPLPKRFAKAFLASVGIADKAVSSLSREEKANIKTLQNYRFAPAGNFGFSKAEVTKGGVYTDEIDSETMMSRKCDGLYFLGEALDVTGELGGYNFQWAFSTAQRLRL